MTISGFFGSKSINRTQVVNIFCGFEETNNLQFCRAPLFTSFGYALSTDLMIEYKGLPFLLSFHGYRNRSVFLPELEFSSPDQRVAINGLALRLQPTVMLWLQPKRQDFYIHRAQPGALFGVKVLYPIGRYLDVYTYLDTKTRIWKGWLFCRMQRVKTNLSTITNLGKSLMWRHTLGQ
ncbi:hypothetical protein [Olivibacter sitiensis]|uniref:hypothetical protein n=1 Tax=Olivibacter sitiensis TaxID=376470 RepID=UPI000489659B|nr:hypothetical protein [Olivibacter sitiensis]